MTHAMTHSSTRLGRISAQLTRQINSVLGDPTAPPEMQSLLLQLQAAIETDGSLSEDPKAQALLQVAELATAAQAPEESAMQSLAKRPLQALRTIEAEAVGAVLGTIAHAFSQPSV